MYQKKYVYFLNVYIDLTLVDILEKREYIQFEKKQSNYISSMQCL